MTARTRRFVVLHGWQNRHPEGHWQRRLAERLTELGHEVAYPFLPDPDDPDLDTWLGTLEQVLAGPRDADRTVVCHSLGCLLWLHALARDLPGTGAGVDRVLLVAPPSAGFVTGHPEIAAFAPPPLHPGLFGGTPTRVVAGDDDPCCPEGVHSAFGRPTGLPVDVVPGGGHLSLDDGYGAWPAVLDWCLDGTTPVAGRV